MPPDPPTPARPGAPDESYRAFAAWMATRPDDTLDLTAIGLAWHAAVAWASRVERERAAKELQEVADDFANGDIPVMAHKPVTTIVQTLKGLADYIRSDPDAPEEADR